MAAIVSIILALISYFGAKKSGASDGTAAAVAAGVGLGSYYVATETEWGKGLVKDVSSWVGVKDPDGNVIKNPDGTVAMVPAGSEVVRQANGTPVTDGNGNVLWKMVDSTGKVLTSWGPVGTATVVGSTALATGKLPSWLLPVGLGAFALFLLK